jgi:DNA invertase Pin-like site-specific DNA recombinase
LLITTALLALLVGALASLLFRRLRPASTNTAMPLAHSVVAEGWARTRSIGPFRGRVHALVLGGGGLFRKPETRYLVSDPGKKGPFWVTHEEVSRLVAPPPSLEAPTYANGAASEDEEVTVLGYVSVRDTGQLENVHLREQADAIASLCGNRGWRLLEVVRDVEETKAGAIERPGLQYALERMGRGEATCLVVSQLGRLSNTASELARVLEWLGHTGGRLVAMDVELDTASPDARVALNALTAVGTWEREPLVEQPLPVVAEPEPEPARTAPLAPGEVSAVKARIVAMREGGMTLQAIADQLNDEGVATIRGGTHWRPSSVRTAATSKRVSRNGASHHVAERQSA